MYCAASSSSASFPIWRCRRSVGVELWEWSCGCLLSIARLSPLAAGLTSGSLGQPCGSHGDIYPTATATQLVRLLGVGGVNANTVIA